MQGFLQKRYQNPIFGTSWRGRLFVLKVNDDGDATISYSSGPGRPCCKKSPNCTQHVKKLRGDESVATRVLKPEVDPSNGNILKEATDSLGQKVNGHLYSFEITWRNKVTNELKHCWVCSGSSTGETDMWVQKITAISTSNNDKQGDDSLTIEEEELKVQQIVKDLSTGNIGDALDMEEELIDRAKHKFGTQSKDYVNIFIKVALIEADHNKSITKNDRFRYYLKEALKAEEALYGVKSHKLVASIQDIGKYYYKWNLFIDAKEMFQKALHICEENLEHDGDFVDSTRYYLGITLYELGEIEGESGAANLLRAVHKVWRMEYGNLSVDFAKTSMALGLCKLALAKDEAQFKKVEDSLKSALNNFEVEYRSTCKLNAELEAKQHVSDTSMDSTSVSLSSQQYKAYAEAEFNFGRLFQARDIEKDIKMSAKKYELLLLLRCAEAEFNLGRLGEERDNALFPVYSKNKYELAIKDPAGFGKDFYKRAKRRVKEKLMALQAETRKINSAAGETAFEDSEYIILEVFQSFQAKILSRTSRLYNEFAHLIEQRTLDNDSSTNKGSFYLLNSELASASSVLTLY